METLVSTLVPARRCGGPPSRPDCTPFRNLQRIVIVFLILLALILLLILLTLLVPVLVLLAHLAHLVSFAMLFCTANAKNILAGLAE